MYTDASESFDLEKLKLPTSLPTITGSNVPVLISVRKPPKHQHGQHFLKGPIPWAWLVAAAKLPGKSLAIGIVLWHLAGLCKQRTVKWQPSKGRSLGVGRHAAYRGIKALERAKLISVERLVGQSPTVTILEPPTSNEV